MIKKLVNMLYVPFLMLLLASLIEFKIINIHWILYLVIQASLFYFMVRNIAYGLNKAKYNTVGVKENE